MKVIFICILLRIYSLLELRFIYQGVIGDPLLVGCKITLEDTNRLSLNVVRGKIFFKPHLRFEDGLYQTTASGTRTNF